MKGNHRGLQARFRYLAIGFIVLFFFYLTPLPAVPADLYKWVDESGNTYYGDKPQGPGAVKITVDTADQGDQEYSGQLQEQKKILQILTDERREKETKLAQDRAQRTQQQLNCQSAQQELQDIQNSQYLFVPTDDPLNPRVLSQEERQSVTLQAEDLVSHWCR